MKIKKIFTSLFILIIGIGFALGGFYLYQQSKVVKPSKIKKINIENPTPIPSSSVFITITNPADEEVSNNRTLKISGTTVPSARIVVLTPTTQEAGIAAGDGKFSTEINLDDGENIIEISAIATNGETAKIKRTVIYSTEDF